MFESLLAHMSRALEGLSSLPWGVHALVAVGMAVGIVLWLIGQRVLKPLLVTGLVILGGLVGALVIPSSGWGASLSVAHAAGIGAVGGLLIGLLLYRSAMAVGFGIVLGAALPLIAASVLQFYPIAEGGGGAVERHAAWLRDSSSSAAASAWERISTAPLGGALPSHARIISASWMDDGASDAGSGAGTPSPAATGPRAKDAAPRAGASPEFIPPNLRPAAERIGEAWSGASTRAREEWESLPDAHRAIIGLAGVLGLAGGVVLGLVMPAWAGSAVSALFGASIWLPCFVWLSNAMSAPWRGLLDRSPASWLAIWGAVALVGIIFQWRTRASRKARAAAAAPVPA